MRKVYLCLVMTFQVITTAMAQVPLSEYATEWKTIFGYEGKDLKDHYENTLEVRVVGDSLINDISYRKLNYFGMIRYAEEGLKCYFRPKRFNSDFLLYDITANVGDTCFLYTGINDDPSCKYSGDGNGDIWVLKEYGLDTIAPWVVTAKTIIDNRTHLKIVLTIDNYAVVERLIVEGVGSECFPMNFQGEAIYDGNGIRRTLCALRDGEPVYSFDLSYLGIINECPEWHLASQDLPETRRTDKARPKKQLHEGRLLIVLPDGRTYDALGRISVE